MNIIDLYRKIHNYKEIRFGIAGVINTLIAISIFPLFYFLFKPFRLNNLIILALSYMVTLIFSFLSSKFYVFRSNGDYKPEFFKFVFLQALYFLINIFALPVIINLWGLGPVVSQTIFASLVIFTSYFWHTAITFGPKFK